MLLLLIALGATCTAVFFMLALSADRAITPSSRLRTLAETPTFAPRVRPTDAPFSERVIRPFLRSMAGAAEKLGLAGDARIVQQKLEVAGKPRIGEFPLGVREYMAMKLACLVVAVFAFLALWRNPVIDGVMGVAFAGFVALIIGMLPTLVVDRLADARKHAVLKSMSDTLDLLVVSAEAGLSLDAAMGRVAQKRRGPLADEFELALQEMRLGKSRAESLRGIARRTGVMEVKMFTSAIIQAENLGVSIAQVLRTQAETHRERRSQRLREAAAKLPVKMMFPLIFFIFPAIFIVLAAPGFIQLMRALSST